ncbi:MAG: pro-sigmaK processing inhibitor BofA family protein [Oscillospiraceae bacterium]|nr:pro-sigmaK processing inhibitor BofA family protein [Candidatus Ruminococcus equi]
MVYVVVLLCSFFVFSFIHFCSKNKKPFKRALLSMIIGPVTLIIVDLLSSVTGVYVPISNLSVISSIVGGIPSVALLVMMGIIV